MESTSERIIEASPQMASAHAKQIDTAKIMQPLVEHVENGGWLEFRHNDGEWRVDKSTCFYGVVMSPTRYRIAK